MDLHQRGREKLVTLIEKGVYVPNPASVDVGEDVDVDRISGDGVTLWPGCRIHGAKTVISAGCTLGGEGPVTLVDCALGPQVDLKGGYFSKSVFLEKANMGLGAQVREGCLLEEEANGAHCVGLKQTILLPFVTLGSLINFCDCLMAGGTSRSDHSEVGSSYVHFNYTPDGDKSTASLFGDVPRGVMLQEPPIFLGGQGGAVGPLRVSYGTVVAAGSVLREDVLEDNMLVAAGAPPRIARKRQAFSYRALPRIVRTNVIYLANLAALDEWYRKVRKPFFERQELGLEVFEAALSVLASAKAERARRLIAMIAKVSDDAAGARELKAHAESVCAVLSASVMVEGEREFLDAARPSELAEKSNYISAVRSLDEEARIAGTRWLTEIVNQLCGEVATLLPSFNLEH